MKRLLVADDHALVRDALCAFLAHEADFDVAAASSLTEAVDRIDGEGPYDLVLLDYDMPGMDGLAGLQRAIARNAGRPVALMSGSAGRDIAGEALANGASGFLPKTLAAASLILAARLMLSGETFAPVAFMTGPAPTDEVESLAAALSPRERQALAGLHRGLSNKEIARELQLQEVTVKLHVKTLCRKLGARNRTQAAMIAKEAGLI